MSTVGAINSNTVAKAMPYSLNDGSLSADQKAGITSILENFDSENLSASDARSITSEFKKLGVQPGRALEAAMAAVGFDARQVGSLAFGQNQPPRESGFGEQAAGIVRSAVSELKALLNSNTSTDGASDAPNGAASDQTGSFISTFLSSYSDSVSASLIDTISGPGAARRDGPLPPPQGGGYEGGSEITAYLESLISSITQGADSNAASGSGESEFAGLVKSASELLKANEVQPSVDNVKSFMQILQNNVAAMFDGTGQFVDRTV